MPKLKRPIWPEYYQETRDGVCILETYADTKYYYQLFTITIPEKRRDEMATLRESLGLAIRNYVNTSKQMTKEGAKEYALQMSFGESTKNGLPLIVPKDPAMLDQNYN